jgi:zinc transport system substrate-binding protein
MSAAVSGSAAPLKIYVSIPPQKWLVQAIGGSQAEIKIVLGKGQDPHTFEPSPRQLVGLSRADIYFTIGMTFEERISEKLRNAGTGLRIIDMSQAVQKIPLSGEVHESDDPHSHKHTEIEGALDPHIWLSPLNLIVMVQIVTETLAEADPGNRNVYEQNALATKEKLTTLHEEISSRLAPYRGESFFVYHPSFGYFAHTYGLNQYAIELDGKTPSPRQLSRLIADAREAGARVLFVQPQFDPKSARAAAQAIGGTVVPLDPLDIDVYANLSNMADSIQQAFQQQ